MGRLVRRLLAVLLFLGISLGAPVSASALFHPSCRHRTVSAEVVALDQVFFWNRYGAVQPQGMIYALRRDVVSVSPTASGVLRPGQVMLRRDKRPRPLVLRMNEGDCLRIRFTNLLSPLPVDQQQPATRAASIHVVGLQAVETIRDDGGSNASGVVDPGESIEYTLFGEREGTYVFHSMGAIVGGEGDAGSISAGLFGAVNVEPRGSEWYRSQVTEEDLRLASEQRDGFPVIDYQAVYPSGHPRAGIPILRMLLTTDKGPEIVHSDLTAIITGPNAGELPATYPYASTLIYPDRRQPFREFTIIFHDEVGAVQAFPHFEDRVLQFTLHSVRDAFAINYGTGGAGAEILANRLEVGPAHDCAECKYEEFFLSAWVVGDPAMVVDVPASSPCTEEELRLGINCTPRKGPKAQRAYYPDDPSNVYHSYLNDHVKFRNSHAGSDDHHIFHLHSHQWLHTPKSDRSAYLDSQAIGQGGSFTYEIAFGGGGNRNRTVGDAIFHCHFYPHFAQGMWSMWRVHDVLETGTKLEGGVPAKESRALPDGEIATGTPIPAVVPLPTLSMAPIPGPVWIEDGQVRLPDSLKKNPGYPFFIPGIAGRRPPHPPLDTIHDGGLPRHVVVDGVATSQETRLDFNKHIKALDVRWISEAGEPVEQMAMDFHAEPLGYATPAPDGSSGATRFQVNGRPRAPGAPFADPCEPKPKLRIYKAADIQLDVQLNKAGWHFPQQRMISLWHDVKNFLEGRNPPEPLFFRAESSECIEYWLTNLVPNIYELDDFQVRTPTDILGQHIHLVKFDVTASDGSGNGFNYEDGSFSPQEVVERIKAIRAFYGCDENKDDVSLNSDPTRCPVAKEHPFFKLYDANHDGDDRDWLGAQTTVQRWWADPLSTQDGEKRTIRTVFTHDHFGPSTHQQTGLYAGLVIEPEGTATTSDLPNAKRGWFHNETSEPLSFGRDDGGPTSWQARVEGPTNETTYREFLIAHADFQLAYEAGSPARPDPVRGFADPPHAINPPGRKRAPLPYLYKKPDVCPINDNDPDGTLLKDKQPPLPPCPEAVSADDPGMSAVNYRNEPIALRIRDPLTRQQAAGKPGDLSWAYSSWIERADPRLNQQPGPPLTRDAQPTDPFTPLIRVLEGDRVHIRTLVGAHEEEHVFNVHGLKWLSEPDDKNSGYRSSQMVGLSEWFDFEVPRVPSIREEESADFLYKPQAATEFQWNGAWGILRVYRQPDEQKKAEIRRSEAVDRGFEARTGVDLVPLRTNQDGQADTPAFAQVPAPPAGDQDAESFGAPRATVPSACPVGAPRRLYEVHAMAARDLFPGGSLVYNRRPDAVRTYHHQDDLPEPRWRSGPLLDPTAILFVRHEDLDWTGKQPRLKPGIRPEPLVLRARSGDCIEVKLHNHLPEEPADRDGWNALPMIIEEFNANHIRPSSRVGLHPQLVYYDVRTSDGVEVGFNPEQTIPPGGDPRTYYWYAGGLDVDGQTFAIELGSAGLTSSDPIEHTSKGAVGALIVEPPRAFWKENVRDANGDLTRASADVWTDSLWRGWLRWGKFRENVLVFQDNVNFTFADGAPVENLIVSEDPTESGQKAVNYRSEPIWFRTGLAPDTPLERTREFSFFDQVLSNAWIGGDPETPVFEARQGQPMRFRVVHPGGHTQSHVFHLHGHLWQELPYTSASLRLGDNPNSEWQGPRSGHGPTNQFDVLIRNGGGRFWVAGDYLYRDYPAWLLNSGIWGLLRIRP